MLLLAIRPKSGARRRPPPTIPTVTAPDSPDATKPAQSVSADAGDVSAESSFELVNPLLESADFTHILKNVTGCSSEAEDEASSADQH